MSARIFVNGRVLLLAMACGSLIVSCTSPSPNRPSAASGSALQIRIVDVITQSSDSQFLAQKIGIQADTGSRNVRLYFAPITQPEEPILLQDDVPANIEQFIVPGIPLQGDFYLGAELVSSDGRVFRTMDRVLDASGERAFPDSITAQIRLAYGTTASVALTFYEQSVVVPDVDFRQQLALSIALSSEQAALLAGIEVLSAEAVLTGCTSSGHPETGALIYEEATQTLVWNDPQSPFYLVPGEVCTLEVFIRDNGVVRLQGARSFVAGPLGAAALDVGTIDLQVNHAEARVQVSFDGYAAAFRIHIASAVTFVNTLTTPSFELSATSGDDLFGPVSLVRNGDVLEGSLVLNEQSRHTIHLLIREAGQPFLGGSADIDLSVLDAFAIPLYIGGGLTVQANSLASVYFRAYLADSPGLTTGITAAVSGPVRDACITGAAGDYTCRLDLPFGEYAVWYSYPGYTSVATTVSVHSLDPMLLAYVALKAPPRVIQIAGGRYHACALLDDGTVRCWGENTSGRLGDGSSVSSSVPVTVAGLDDAVEIVAGGAHTCARRQNGTVQCWGANNYGMIGDGSTVDRLVPTTVVGITDAIDIASGANHNCAVRADRTVWCWGYNWSGQLGEDAATYRTSPVAVAGLTNVSMIAGGGNHTCALRADGDVYCWGANNYGQLGDGTTISRPTPAPVNGLGEFVSLTAGSGHSCAVLNDGSAVCWGHNADGQLGNGATQNASSPVVVSGLSSVTEVVSFGFANHTCALHTDGTMSCWGSNLYSQLGDGTTSKQVTPVAVAGLTDAVSLAVGGAFSCSLLQDGTVACWGDNASGQLGDGTTVGSATPVPVTGLP